MAWDRDRDELEAWPDVCWYDWDKQKASLIKLTAYQFQWVLPGHGQQVQLSTETMAAQMKKLIERLDDL